MVRKRVQTKSGRLLTACQIGLLCCGFYASSPHAAHAQDFTFTVPIRLSNMHPTVTEFRVDCLVSIVPVGGSGPAAAGNILGYGSVTHIPLVPEGDAMGFSGDVVVRVESDGGLDPALGRSYTCQMRLRAVVPPSILDIRICRPDPLRPQYNTTPGAECRSRTGSVDLPRGLPGHLPLPPPTPERFPLPAR